MVTRGAFAAILAAQLSLLSVACRPSVPPQDPSADPAETYALRAPSELTPDMVVEQHIQATKDGRSGGFDAVVQKTGNELVVVGLGPVGVRAFVVRQQGTETTFEQRMGPTLPFSPRNVLIDVHRVFFKRLPLPGPAPEGELRGEVDAEEVVETWHQGSLVERRFTRTREPAVDVRVLYGPGCLAARCEPQGVRLINVLRGYELTIDNRRFHAIGTGGASE